MRPRNAGFLVGIFLGIFIVGAAIGSEVIDRILAVVDEDIILESEVHQYLQFNLTQEVDLRDLTNEQLNELKMQVLEELIRQKVLLAKARADTVTIPDRELDRELDNRLQTLEEQLGSQEKITEYYGMPISAIRREFRDLVREGMMIEQLKRFYLGDIRVARADVETFWESYQDSIPAIEEAVKLSHILLRDEISDISRRATVEHADSIRRMIHDGEVEFEAAARRLSEDPASAKADGLLGTTSRGDLVPAYEEIAYALEDGKISEPVETQFGVHLIRLNWRKGEKISTSHILFEIVPTAADEESTMVRAGVLRDSIFAGKETFAEAAQRISWDAKSAAKGGALGWFKPEELPDDFRVPARKLAAGELSEPFRAQFGVHLLKVEDRQDARTVSLAEDYERIEQMTLMQKRELEFAKWIDKLQAQTYIEIKQ